MPTSLAYEKKRDYFMGCARTAHRHIDAVPERHHHIIRRMITNYVRQARRMHHEALALQRFEDEAEFRSRVRRDA